MTIMECPHCGKTIDKRGYNSHVRACAEKKQEQEDKIMKENEEQKPEPKPESEEIKDETESKNPKARNWIKPIVAVLGVLAAGIIGILMLISPKSKESSKKESPTRKPGSRLNR